MKLTIFILCISTLTSLASLGYAQSKKLTVIGQNVKVIEILSDIEDQSEFRFFFSNDVNVDRVTSIDMKDKIVFEILDELFKNTNIKYEVYERQIALVDKSDSFFNRNYVQQQENMQQNTVSGRVTDSGGQPLPGVTVVVKGTTQGTVTNASGEYTLSNIPNDATLVFSFVGMRTQEVVIGSQTKIDAKMKEDVIGIEEVVAIGYGSLKKKDLTSSVTTVSASELNKGVYSNPIMQLQGKVPGLNITSDGNPGGTSSVLLRGPSTLRTGSAQEPFYVIDGVAGASLSLVPPDDIVSIDVLRDASATAIYGSRAANGVIIITTKRGQEGSFKISYNAYSAVEIISNSYDVLSGEEYRNWLASNNLSLDPIDDDGVNTNWADEITRQGFSHNNNLSISGGNNKTTYVASINYHSKEGIIKGSSLNRFIMRSNVEQKMLNDRLKLGFTSLNSITDSESVPNDVYLSMWKYLPTVNIRNADGTFRENLIRSPSNPVALIEQNINESRNKVFLGSAHAKLNIFKGLDYEVNASYQNSQSNGNAYAYKGSALALAYNGLATRNSYENEKKLLETFASYNKVIKMHDFKALVGYSWQEEYSGNGFQTSSSNFVSDKTLYYNLGMGSNFEGFVPDYGSTAITTLRMISGYARLNYSYKDRYLLQATVRRDGSSAFGKNNRWGTFPSVSAGWRITEEKFMQNQQFFGNLKLRAGYGVSGNSLGFNPLISMLRYGVSGTSLYDGDYIKGIIPTQNENPNLKWEVTEMLNLGLDFAILSGKLSGTVEYYEKTTDDLLWTYAVSPTKYYVSYYTANVGSMENKGVEVTLSANPIQTNNFSWNSSLVLSHNKNLLTSLSNDEFQLEYLYIGAVGNHGQSGMNSQILQEGYPVGTFYTWKYAGPDENGQSQFYKEDGSLTTNPLSTDRYYAGNAQPKLTGGWRNTLTYKNLSIDFFLRGVTGNKIMNVTLCNLNYPSEATHYNQHRMVLDASGIDQNAAYTSTRYLEKGDYLRMDNVTLMYSFNLKNPLIKGLKIYSTVNNAFVITKYKGCDPEVYMGGLTPGIDDDRYYPKTRSFIFGVNVDF